MDSRVKSLYERHGLPTRAPLETIVADAAQLLDYALTTPNFISTFTRAQSVRIDGRSEIGHRAHALAVTPEGHRIDLSTTVGTLDLAGAAAICERLTLARPKSSVWMADKIDDDTRAVAVEMAACYEVTIACVEIHAYASPTGRRWLVPLLVERTPS